MSFSSSSAQLAAHARSPIRAQRGICAPAITQLLPKNARMTCTRVSVPRVQFDSAPDEAQRLQIVVAVRSVMRDLACKTHSYDSVFLVENYELIGAWRVVKRVCDRRRHLAALNMSSKRN